MCSVAVALEHRAEIFVKPDGAALKVVSADLWHRRMCYANSNPMEVLRKMPNSGVEYNGNLTPCDVCSFGKSEQQPRPKHASYDVQGPFENVTVDTMGPINPPALGGYTYVINIVDQLTKWGEDLPRQEQDTHYRLPRAVQQGRGDSVRIEFSPPEK